MKTSIDINGPLGANCGWARRAICCWICGDFALPCPFLILILFFFLVDSDSQINLPAFVISGLGWLIFTINHVNYVYVKKIYIKVIKNGPNSWNLINWQHSLCKFDELPIQRICCLFCSMGYHFSMCFKIA